MNIGDTIKTLHAIAATVGYDAEIPVMREGVGENDFIVPDYGVMGKLEDQDGRGFRCALIGSNGGTELTAAGTPHYKWKPSEMKVKP